MPEAELHHQQSQRKELQTTREREASTETDEQPSEKMSIKQEEPPPSLDISSCLLSLSLDLALSVCVYNIYIYISLYLSLSLPVCLSICPFCLHFALFVAVPPSSPRLTAGSEAWDDGGWGNSFELWELPLLSEENEMFQIGRGHCHLQMDRNTNNISTEQQQTP